ncbi:MFS transporter [Parageobacillus toebii]|uniref:MFS transporter n=1 Tax=Parageobacillus toebii TaxID=153151 RepID=UPI0035B51C69
MEAALKRGESTGKATFSLFYFFIFFAFGALFPLLSVYLQEVVGLSGTEIGVIMSISPVTMIFVQPIWGMITDYTRKPVFVLTIALLATSFIGLMYSFVHEYHWLIVMAVLLASAQSAIVPISDSIALHYAQKNGEKYGSIRLWGSIGFAVAVLIGGWLSDRIALVVIFYLFSFMLILSGLLASRLPKESQTMKAEALRGMAQLFRIPHFVLLLLATFFIFGPILANNFYFGIFIKQLGGTLTGIGLAFLLAAGSEAPFMKMTDGLIHRFGMVPLLMFATAVSCLRWLFYFFEPPLFFVYMTTIVQGLSVGLSIPAALQYVRDVAPKQVRATAVSLYSAVGNGLGVWFCTFIGGYMLERYHIGAVYLFFSICTFVGMLSLVCIHLLNKKKASA